MREKINTLCIQKNLMYKRCIRMTSKQMLKKETIRYVPTSKVRPQKLTIGGWYFMAKYSLNFLSLKN